MKIIMIPISYHNVNGIAIEDFAEAVNDLQALDLGVVCEDCDSRNEFHAARGSYLAKNLSHTVGRNDRASVYQGWKSRPRDGVGPDVNLARRAHHRQVFGDKIDP